MTFDQYIQSIGVNPEQLYTYAEVAAMMQKEPSTIRSWCNLGFRTRKWGIVSLNNFKRGREAVVQGSCLIDFLRKIQVDH